jgi:DNA modification methylase
MKTATLSIDHVAIDSLNPDPANPRRISDAELEALTRSVREFGFVQPVVVRRQDYTVIGGHQRLLAARKLGLKLVPVIFLDVTQEQARLLNIALNKISGEFDEELLARMLDDLKEAADLTITGFTEDDLDALLKGLDAREKREKPESFDVDAALEAARAATRARHGQLWALGDHRLLIGDAGDTAAVQRLLDGKHAAMCFTDPPYNVSLGDHGGQQRGQRRRRIQNDAMSAQEFDAFCSRWMPNVIGSVDGAIYIAMSSKELPRVTRIFEAAGGHWSDYVIWKKDRFTLGRADYQRQYEPILFGWREGAKHQWHGGRDQGDVWEIERPFDNAAHPTMKPLALVEKAIANSSSAGDIILDLFLGSGSTLIACERTGRVCYGMEISEHYGSVVLARWESFTGKTAQLIEPQEKKR